MRNIPTLEEILAIHKYLIDEFGGPHGVRDIGSVESALGRLTSGYYKDIVEESAALMESLSQNHPFVDGNKRIAFYATDVFLRMNGKFIECDNDEAFSFFNALFETSTFDFEHLVEWLRDHIIDL